MNVSIHRGLNIPSVFVSTESGSMKQVDRIKRYKEAGYLARRDGEGQIEYDAGLIHVKLRGNTSAQFNKKIREQQKIHLQPEPA